MLPITTTGTNKSERAQPGRVSPLTKRGSTRLCVSRRGDIRVRFSVGVGSQQGCPRRQPVTDRLKHLAVRSVLALGDETAIGTDRRPSAREIAPKGQTARYARRALCRGRQACPLWPLAGQRVGGVVPPPPQRAWGDDAHAAAGAAVGWPTTMTPAASTTIGWRNPNSRMEFTTASTALSLRRGFLS